MVNFNLFSSRINKSTTNHDQDLSNLTEHSSSSSSSNHIQQTHTHRLIDKLRSSSTTLKSKPSLLHHPQALTSHSSLLSPLPSPSPSRSASQSSTFSRFRQRASSLKPLSNHHHQLNSSSISNQLAYQLPSIDLQEELVLDHSTLNSSNSITTTNINMSSQSQSQPPSPSLSLLKSQSPSQSKFKSTSPSKFKSPSPSLLKSQPQSPSQSVFKSTPSIRSNNTIFSFRSKFRVGRRKQPDAQSMNRQDSQTSVSTTLHPPNPSVSPKLNPSASLYSDPSLIKSTDLNSSQSSSVSSFQLKSFRNVRSTSSPGEVPLLESIPTTPKRQQTTPTQKTTFTQSSNTPTQKTTFTQSSNTPTQSIRSSPVPLIQASPNPSCTTQSPSSSKRISAAAFREARQARTTSRSSLNSTYSDKSFLQYDPHQHRSSYWAPSNSSINLYQGFSMPSLMNSGRAMSDIGLPSQSKPSSSSSRHHPHQSGTPKPSPSDHFKRNVSQPTPNSGRLSYYHNSKAFENETETDILIPPRPAFYGSSSSSSTSRSSHDQSSSTTPFYKTQSTSQRSLMVGNSSQRSLPIHTSRPISSMMIKPTSSKKLKDSTPLDKWHSDSESDSENPPHQLSKDDHDEEDDEVPLSKLKKKSFSSLKVSSAKPFGSLIPPISITPTSGSGSLPLVHPPQSPQQLQQSQSQQQQQQSQQQQQQQQQQQSQQYRGISPASSSSGGSAGPITPLDSSLAINLIRKDDEFGLEHAPNGVDQVLYNGLSESDKYQLHQRSQMMIQMIAAQAQMHAISLSNHQTFHQLTSNEIELGFNGMGFNGNGMGFNGNGLGNGFNNGMGFNGMGNMNGNGKLGYGRGSQSLIGINEELGKKRVRKVSGAASGIGIGTASGTGSGSGSGSGSGKGKGNHSSDTITKLKP